jgi:uncharacterized protein (UPF0333 family)
MRYLPASLGVLLGQTRGTVSLEYALLAAAALLGLLVGAAALPQGESGPVERALMRASAAVQAGDAPSFSARGGDRD